VELVNVRVESPRAATIGGLAVGEYVVLTVADTGAGIPPEIKERIFDPFFTTKEVGTGTGLGLSICQTIAAAHGGVLDAALNADRGMTFSLRLPVAPEVPAGTPAAPPRRSGSFGPRTASD